MEGAILMNRLRGIWTDQKVEILMGNLLRAGVLTSALIVLCGGLTYLARHGREVPAYQVFQGEPLDLKTVSGILEECLALRGRGIIQFGLLLLIATPVARVAFSIYAFSRQHDWAYVAFTLIVLGLLLYSLSGGLT